MRFDELLRAIHDQRVRRRIEIVDFAGIGDPKFLSYLRDSPTFAEIRGVIRAIGDDRNENQCPRDATHHRFDKQARQKEMNEKACEKRTAQEGQVKAR
ncbi:MAG: hypothetical protein ABSD09_19780 [Xanthobacteraceae bacterium]